MNKGEAMMSRMVLGIGVFCALLAGATARMINVPAEYATKLNVQ